MENNNQENNMALKTVIIFDPVCGLEIGHNLPTIDKYAHWLNREFGYICEGWVATKNTQSKDYLNFRKLPWVYGYWLPDNVKDEIRNKKKPIKNNSVLNILLNSTHHFWAFKRIERSLSKAMFMNPSYIFLPGADFYSLISIWSMAKRRLVPHGTIIIIRLIGVMEWATKIPRAKEIVSQIIFEIKIILGDSVRFTAETEKYAFEVGAILNSIVPVTSIPMTIISNTTKYTPKREASRDFVNIVCLGGARPDKGYFDILELDKITNILATSQQINRKVRYFVQSMSTRHIDYDWNYQFEMARTENIQILKPRLTDQELSYEIQRADIVLLPYAEETYASRGSAILFDTLSYGKPILGVGNTGFGDTIKHAGIGLVYNGIDDYLNRLIEMLNYSAETVEIIKRNQEKYSMRMLTNLRACFDD